MPTFLPFRRAVKAHPESLAVCALAVALLATSCASRGVERPTGGPLAPTLGTATAPITADAQPASIPPPGSAPIAAAGVSQAASDWDGGAAAASFEVEEPYPIDARSRSASPLQASADEEELARWNLGGTADPSYPSSQASFHPGTRVVVDTRLARRRAGTPSSAARGLSSDRVQAQTRSKGYWPFRLCFEAGQRDKKGLGGETRVAFTINVRGSVSSARLIASQLGNPTSAACLVRELGKLRFSPRPAKHLDVLASIRLWPGDAELPPPPDAAPAPVDTNNAFDPRVVRARVTNRRKDLDACVADARRADPTLWGRLALAVVLEVDGSVHQVREVESHFPSPAVARCAAAVLSSIVFPSVNGKPFSVVLALRLAPNASAEPDSNANAPSPVDDAGTD